MSPPSDIPAKRHGGERTMLAEAPSFSPSGKTWRPYRPSGLEPVSRRGAVLTRQLLEIVPVHGPGLTQALETRLKELLDLDCRVSLEHVVVVRPKDLPRRLLLPTYLAVLSPAPHRIKALLDVELSLAHPVVDVLLGGAGETVMPRPLTDIEDGVMAFIVLEALRAIGPTLDSGLPKIRFEGPVHSLEAAQESLAGEEQLLLLQFRMGLGSHVGYVRLFVPSSVLGLVVPSGSPEERRTWRRSLLARGIGRLAGVRTSVRAEIGRAMISADDLKSVRLKDVVLIEECTARPDKGQGGLTRLKIGAGKTGYLEADLLVQTNRLSAKIRAFVPGESPRVPDESSSERQENGVDASENEGAELLNDIPLQVAVEVARVPLSAEDLVTLKAGQVIDLKRSAGEPVELSVNGKIVARGELVEVEGNLGVRVLSILG